MAEPLQLDEKTMDIPAGDFQLKTAFSMDIGGSMGKLIYATEVDDCVRLHFASFPRRQTEAGVDILRDKMAGKLPEGTVINTCGVGFQEFTGYLHRAMGVTVQNNPETDCFIDGFTYMLKHLPLESIVHSESQTVKQAAPGAAAMIAEAINVLSGSGARWELAGQVDPQTQDRPTGVEFPVMLCMLGSAGACFKVEADGSFKVTEISTRCGRMLLGLGKLIVGAQTFGELMDLAAAGSADEVHIQARHLQTGADDPYSSVPEEFMIYCFGQAMDRHSESFSKADLAAALVSMICQDLAQCCHMAAMIHNTKTMFFCGNFVGASKQVREEINKFLSIRCLLNSLEKRYECHFLRFGGYYGALGALLRTLRGPPKIAEAESDIAEELLKKMELTKPLDAESKHLEKIDTSMHT